MCLASEVELAAELSAASLSLRRMPIRMHFASAPTESVPDLGHARTAVHAEGLPRLVECHEASTRYR